MSNIKCRLPRDCFCRLLVRFLRSYQVYFPSFGFLSYSHKKSIKVTISFVTKSNKYNSARDTPVRIRFSRSIEERKKIKTDFFYFFKYYKSCASYPSVTCRWGASRSSSRTTRTSTASSASRTRLPPSAPSARTSSPAVGSPSGIQP
jgi:hypothetical protein